MKYTKPSLTIDEQVKLLQSRGMAGDPTRIGRRLKVVNYYRLSGYWYPFRNPDNSFAPGTNIEEVWKRYMFDRKLRLLVMDAIERIEVAVRTQIAYHQSSQFGPFGYIEQPNALPTKVKPDRTELLEWIRKDVTRSRESFMNHFQKKYGSDHPFPPIWIATEVLSFGTVVALYRRSPKWLQKNIAKEFDVPSVAFQSWLLTLNTIRNYCAHHSRLYNRVFTLKPEIPPKHSVPDWHSPFVISNDRVFAILSICRYLMQRIAPNSQWGYRVVKLIEDHPNIPLIVMGIPQNWKDHELWREI
ncbi:MAG: Abi family protein [Bacteroidetes bacterium]|nr:Abi family protein [Bacteroidota bacterium]